MTASQLQMACSKIDGHRGGLQPFGDEMTDPRPDSPQEFSHPEPFSSREVPYKAHGLTRRGYFPQPAQRP